MDEKYTTRGERRRKQAEKQKKESKGPKQPKTLLKRIFLTLVTIGIVVLLAGLGTLAYFISDAPDLDESLLKDPVSSKIRDVNGELLAEVGKEKRDYVNYEDIPDLVENAFLATEDSRFYKHNGVDFLRFTSAVMANITSGFGSQGGSTITQQVVKRSYLTPDKTIKRKVQEMWLSIQLERKYTKEEILEMYVNKIWFANSANGILTAAKTYYGKDLDELELHEVAMLVGLPQSPSRYEPYGHPDRAKERRNVVLHLMNKHGYISDEEMKNAQSKSIEDGLKPKDTSQVDTTPYDAFVDLVIEEVQEMGDYNIFTDGLEIYTTIDKDAQEYVFNLLNSNDTISYPNENLQAGITLLDTQTGEIRAIGGGRNTTVKRGWNYATDTKRSPGSTIKPIIDYGPAVEYLNWSTYHQITDEPYAYSDGTPLKNASGRHYGTMTVREALGRSLNIPAVKTLQEVGLDNAKQFTTDLGISFPKEGIVESSALGGGMEVSTLELAGAYSAFGNNGIYNKPHTIKKIVLRDKTEIKNKTVSEPVMKDSTAFIVSNMLQSVLSESYGTGQLANIPGLPVAGKTGSTNFTPAERAEHNIPSSAVKDSWMAGYTTNYTLTVWAGYNNSSKEDFDYLGESSQRIPKYIFKNIMQYVSNGKQTEDFKQPSSVVKVGIIKGSNPAVKANQYTPSDQITYEYYVQGHEPKQVTTEYTKETEEEKEKEKEKESNAPTGVSATYNAESNAINVSWGYPKPEDAPQFEVKVSVDGGAATVLSSTKDMGLTMNAPTPGSTYTFSVVATVNGQSSKPVSASVSIPDGTEEEELIDEDPELEDGSEENPEETNPEQEQPDDVTPPGQENNNPETNPDNPDKNNGNGNGNGNDNGTSNGNGNGNGSNNNPGNKEDDEEDGPVEEETTDPGETDQSQ
ncbi:PBP1A family penicillin-binding protein [Peribacillus asahii]|uniref:transglycosylase domain-containing protein n=1 Tax=Peribacillus asahii TaxID=228899 RepID=UPI00382C3D2A